MSVRRDLIAEQPLLSGIAAPDIDADAYLPVHSGAAAFYNGTQESFMDRYGNAIYLTPMALGALASMFAAAWQFLGVRPKRNGMHDAGSTLCAAGADTKIDNEAELAEIEDKSMPSCGRNWPDTADREDSASEIHALIAAAHRIDNLVHQRRSTAGGRDARDRGSAAGRGFRWPADRKVLG